MAHDTALVEGNNTHHLVVRGEALELNAALRTLTVHGDLLIPNHAILPDALPPPWEKNPVKHYQRGVGCDGRDGSGLRDGFAFGDGDDDPPVVALLGGGVLLRRLTE